MFRKTESNSYISDGRTKRRNEQFKRDIATLKKSLSSFNVCHMKRIQKDEQMKEILVMKKNTQLKEI